MTTKCGYVFQPLQGQLAKMSSLLKKSQLRLLSCVQLKSASSSFYPLVALGNSLFYESLFPFHSKSFPLSLNIHNSATVPCMTCFGSLSPSWSPYGQFSKSWIQNQYNALEMGVPGQNRKRWAFYLTWGK